MAPYPAEVTLAQGGTLFLDEIGDMPLAAQAKLLRVLETREVFPIGALRSRRVDFHVVAATHGRLEQAVRAGRFRADLFYRLNVARVELLPLRRATGTWASCSIISPRSWRRARAGRGCG